ncbi:hypothetical protein PR202_gb17142 [Eleusine coracana subsp. coracana]|uniref:Uncharacterized protein n=1 Tax=Eleusine coracana subsp. coracana TaxID=191504 RepID=A0AAV5F284_ELECO|nr:hypothetical protein QOZ80_6BG0470110 [Eleusine coracana subsp. coracana]GJN28962.1 hypothetical protein PR202_gb17142 [Eleusine coracana subsp. coracana]
MTSSQHWPWHQPPAPAWFLTLVLLGAVYSAVISICGLAYVLLCLRRPKDLCHRYGPWAVVTGPTSGIRRSMAMELGGRGINLVLLDLNAANLHEISDLISSRHGAKTRTVVFDLSLIGTAQGTLLSSPGAPTLSTEAKGIDVQCQAPFFVTTGMVSRSSLTGWIAPFVPTADAYARAAARWIGYGPLSSPTAAHQLLWCLAPILPDAAFDWILLHAHQRQRATIQKIKAARVASAYPG